MAITLPDPIVDLRDWFRVHPDLTPLVGDRWWWKFPDRYADWPAVRMYDSQPPMILPNGGGIPLIDAHIAFDIFGGSDAEFLTVKKVSLTLVAVLNQLQSDTVIGNTMVKNADATGGINSPDPATGHPRFVLDTRWLCTTP